MSRGFPGGARSKVGLPRIRSRYMATLKMTFTIPEDLAGEFLKRVPARNRSRYVAEAIRAKMREREQQLIQVCEIANAAPDVLALAQEFAGLPDDIAEPWTDAPVR